MKTYYSLTKEPEWDYLIKPAILALAVFAIVLMLMVFAAAYPGFLPSVLIFGPEILKVSLTICLFNFSFLGFNIFFVNPLNFLPLAKRDRMRMEKTTAITLKIASYFLSMQLVLSYISSKLKKTLKTLQKNTTTAELKDPLFIAMFKFQRFMAQK